MKVTNVERIDADQGLPLNNENLDELIETPLVEPIKVFHNKNIKTLMSSCNKYNVNPILQNGANVFTDDIVDKYAYKHVYSFGYGFAYIMFDYDNLSLENKEFFNSKYKELNKDINEQPIRNIDYKNGYQSQKRMIYGVNPTLHEKAPSGFRSDKLFPNMESIPNDVEKAKDDFFIDNYDIVTTSTTKPRIVIIRYPVDENTQTHDVTNFFNSIALEMQEQKLRMIFGPIREYNPYEKQN